MWRYNSYKLPQNIKNMITYFEIKYDFVHLGFTKKINLKILCILNFTLQYDNISFKKYIKYVKIKVMIWGGYNGKKKSY